MPNKVSVVRKVRKIRCDKCGYLGDTTEVNVYVTDGPFTGPVREAACYEIQACSLRAVDEDPEDSMYDAG